MLIRPPAGRRRAQPGRDLLAERTKQADVAIL
jgi:hypothetical protein